MIEKAPACVRTRLNRSLPGPSIPEVAARNPDRSSAVNASRAQQTMLNFRVRDLDAMLAQLRAAGVEVDERVEEQEYGRFGWCVDPEGNRVELWEPPHAA